MARTIPSKKPLRNRARPRGKREDENPLDIHGMAWRVNRLERQVRLLSELVREHAADADRLVRIVAEDREILRQELLKQTSLPRRRENLLGA